MLAGSNHAEEGDEDDVNRLADVAPGQLAVGLDAVLHAVQLQEDVAHLESGLEGGGIRFQTKNQSCNRELDCLPDQNIDIGGATTDSRSDFSCSPCTRTYYY